jgi:hypothetical protein
MKSTPDAELLAKINAAVAVANSAETKVTTAQAELVSRSKTVGLLLLDAKKLHPAVKDFEAFLKRVQGLHLSRAYDLMRLAGGRTTDEELKKEARERVKKHRASKKLPGSSSKKPEPEPVSVTSPEMPANAALPIGHVTETGEDFLNTKEQAAKISAHNLSEFLYACRAHLPKLTETDLKKACAFVTLDKWRSKPNTEAA